MNWNVTLQVAILVIAYIGGVASIGYYITNSLGKRIAGLETNLNNRIDDLRSQMTIEHDTLSDKVDRIHDLLIDHVKDRNLHN